MVGSGDDVFDGILEARRNLTALRAGGHVGHDAPSDDPFPLQGTGEAAEGRVRATAVDGRISSVEFPDSRVLRLDASALAVHLSEAVNSALDDLREKAPSPDPEMAIDLAALAERLREVRTEGMLQMARITSSLQDAMALIRQNASAPGDGAPPNLDELFAETDRTLASVRSDSSEREAEELHGEGASADGLIAARCALPGRVASLTADPHALRSGSVGLAESVRAAVNDALDDLEARQRERGRAAATDAEALERRVRAVQDRSIDLMRAHGRSADDWANSIQPLE
jgi:DNA-binding protein YbaB